VNEKTTPFQFPENPDFNNQVVGISSNIYGYFNFILKDGTRSTQDSKKEPMEDKFIPEERIVRRVDIYSEIV
jgi:hypothetical protein